MFQILLSLVDDDLHGYASIQDVAERTGGEVMLTESTLYAAIKGFLDYAITTTLCPGGKERMRRLMSLLQTERLDLRPFVTHRFSLDQIEEAYELFANQRDRVIKVAIVP